MAKKKKKRISVHAAKAKGRRLQQWTCAMISKVTGLPWGKDELIASREMGQSGVDVRLIGQAKQLFPFSVECKNQESWYVHDWIKQAKSNVMDDTTWLLVAKRNKMNPVIIMDAEKFFQLWDKVLKLVGYTHEKF